MRQPKLEQPEAIPIDNTEATVVFASAAQLDTLNSSAPPSCGEESLPRSYSDDVGEIDDVGETGVSDFIADLARLSDPSCVPRLNRALSRKEVLSPPEAFVASLVAANMNMRTILDMSPLHEDDTLRFLARLVEKGLITLTRGCGFLTTLAGPPSPLAQGRAFGTSE